jgi:hypothetical protein
VTSVAEAGGPVSLGLPASVCEAWWSNWWGSPQLLGRQVRATIDAVERTAPGPASCAITVCAGGHTEDFASPEALVAGVSPEALARFTRITATIAGSGLEARLSWERPHRQGASRQVVRLRVAALEPSAAEGVAREVIPAVGWAYRPYWGACGRPDAVLARSAYERHGPNLRYVLIFALALVLGVLLARAVDRLPGAGLPSWATALVVASGAAIPFVLDRAVPDVEVAALGRTRLRAIGIRMATAVASALGSQLLVWLAGR